MSGSISGAWRKDQGRLDGRAATRSASWSGESSRTPISFLLFSLIQHREPCEQPAIDGAKETRATVLQRKWIRAAKFEAAMDDLQPALG